MHILEFLALIWEFSHPSACLTCYRTRVFPKFWHMSCLQSKKGEKVQKKQKKTLDFFRLFVWSCPTLDQLFWSPTCRYGLHHRRTLGQVYLGDNLSLWERSIWPTMGEIQCKNHNFWKTKLWSSISPLPRSAQRKYFACKLDLCMATWSQKISTLARRTKMVL